MTTPASGPRRTLVQVLSTDRRLAVCKRCRAPVEWFKTVTRPRMMLFNGVAPIHKVDLDPATGVPRWYLDRKDCHWEHCASR